MARKKKKARKEEPTDKEKPQPAEQEEQKEEKIEETKKEEPETPPLPEEPIPVTDYLYMMIASLDAKAWAYMDFIVHPETQKHKKDLAQAKLAIDAIDVMYKTIQDRLPPEMKKDIETRITNLRLNFVKTS